MSGITEKAVGVMDKGQLQNNTGNFGELASFFSWFTNAGHWPRSAASTRQYFFGMGLLVGINKHNVIETSTQSVTQILDWLPPSDASEKQYSGDVRAVSDNSPFQASSDLIESWPRGYYDEDTWINDGVHHWPGHYALDLDNPDYPETIIEKKGKFVSDRDVYCCYNDDNNPNGSANIIVEQTGYSYSRSYAEDFIFFELKIHNTGLIDHDSIYVGLYSKFRPDFDSHDYVHFTDSDNDKKKDLIIVYDINNRASQAWNLTPDTDPLGMVGLRIYDTPYDMGVTNFHHFANGVKPGTDEELWAIMTSDKTNPAINSYFYFHGDDENIDNTDDINRGIYYPATTYEETDPPYSAELEGDAINTIWSVGPFTLKADSFVTLSVGLIMGDAGKIPDEPDFTDLMANVDKANEMYMNHFQGPAGSPEPPILSAAAGHKKATLSWDPDPSESSIDGISGKKDFEGYKIFKSTDQGTTWGQEIIDSVGNFVAWEPIAIFDKINDVLGSDPAFPLQSLGNNSGLVYTYIDSNLVNDKEYWYCVSAYDHGNQNPDSLEQSYMYPIGASIYEQHTISVTPGPFFNGDTLLPLGNILPQGGACGGIVQLELYDPDAITGHGYKITFSENVVNVSEYGDTTYTMGLTLVDITEIDTLFCNYPIP
ncbi:MAG: hypothetical protein KAI81_09870, partial [Candidatus Marinimicrobia bacterium]|nr:hypothetical protein [Candidatus Neomarinimicrobiota bacterium]